VLVRHDLSAVEAGVDPVWAAAKTDPADLTSPLTDAL
jgi:hypothetical protein